MPLRLLLFIFILSASLLIGRFITNDFIGAALIRYGTDEASRNAAVSYAGSNPEMLAARARFLLYRTDPARPADAVRDLQKAAQLSPHDYRYHLELGRAFAMNGDNARAEQALQKAVITAPNYFETHWMLANFFLRAGKTEETVNAFRRALELSGGRKGTPDRNAAMSAYAALASLIASDSSLLTRVTPSDAVSQSYAAAFLADTGALDQALTLWRELPQSEPASYRSLLFRLLDRAQHLRRFNDAHEVWRKFLQMDSSEAAQNYGQPDELIFNAGFEQPAISEKYPDMAFAQTGFDWIIRLHPEVRVRRDGLRRHTGAQSLRLTFNAVMHTEFQEVSQLIPVEPSQMYQLKCFVRTERMPDRDMPFLELRDAASEAAPAVRVNVPGGNHDWRELALEFITLPNAQAMRLTIRSPLQTIFSATNQGELWLDDFTLEKMKRAGDGKTISQ